MTAEALPGERDAAWDFLQSGAGVVVLVVDDAGVVRAANRHARERSGRRLEGERLESVFLNFRGAPVWDELRSSPLRPCLLNARTAGGLPETLYVTLVPTRDGSLVIGQTDAAEQDRLRREVLALSREAAEMTRELARRAAELGELNEEKNRFLGMATHDLRRPAGVVRNAAELLLDELAGRLDEEHLRLLRMVRSSAERMGRVVEDFLDVAVIESGRLRLELAPCEAASLLAMPLDWAAPLARRRGVRLDVETLPDRVVLRADGPKLEQAVSNLLSNAVEHSPDGSAVRVRLTREGSGLRLDVTDRGPGIHVARRAELFTEFGGTGRRKPSGERSVGLGLALARRVVEAHGGRMVVESPEGEGARVGFLLPPSCLAASSGEEAAE